MANFTEQIAALTVATAVANGKIETEELTEIYGLADSLELDANELKTAVAKEMQNPSSIEAAAKLATDAEEKSLLLEACILIAVADNSLDLKEVEVLTKVCEALGLSQSKMALTLAAIAQNNRQIKIVGNDSDFDGDEMIFED
ncbi:MAG: TerB family tellurite resistance protein [Paludibacteraceae bacterium]|nr:TerB family tellurite resistance protein [Paludibacteraceae bacterium]